MADDALLFEARLRHIIEMSLQAMKRDDRARRIAWCQETGQHGVRLVAEDDAYRLEWGGRTLALLEEDVFLGEDTYLRDLQVLGTSLPDTLEGLG
jgi:hypothetical protein